MNYGSLADWFVAFGTILLGLIAIFQDRMRAYLRSPKLDCEIELNPPDCHRTIAQMRVGYSFYTYYYRFKIWNNRIFFFRQLGLEYAWRKRREKNLL